MTGSECQDVNNNVHKQLSGLHHPNYPSESVSVYNIETVSLFYARVRLGNHVSQLATT
jgi:hypothetical protein